MLRLIEDVVCLETLIDSRSPDRGWKYMHVNSGQDAQQDVEVDGVEPNEWSKRHAFQMQISLVSSQINLLSVTFATTHFFPLPHLCPVYVPMGFSYSYNLFWRGELSDHAQLMLLSTAW